MLHATCSRGFTLIETLVAISVLLTAIAAPLTIAAKSLFTARNTQDQLIAVFLAQEALEAVRSKRDDSTLSGANWAGGLPPSIPASCLSELCGADVMNATNGNATTIALCTALNACVVTRNGTLNTFSHQTGGSWSNTKFTRTITVTSIDSKEFRADVDVSWNNGFVNRTFKVRENMLDWQ